MACWFELPMRDDEAHDLRAILEQDARPGTLQSRLISRLDAAIEAAKRPRYPRARLVLTEPNGCGCRPDDPLCAVHNVEGRCASWPSS